MKKKSVFFLTLFLLVVIGASTAFIVSRSGRIKTPAIHAIPADAEIILEVFNPFETGRTNLQFPFWRTAGDFPEIQSFIHDFNDLDSLIRNNEKTHEFFQEATLYISSHPYHSQTHWLFVCNIDKTIKPHFIDQFVVKANKEHPLEKIKTEYGTINRIKMLHGNRFFHYTLKNNIWIASMHLERVKSALRTIKEKNGYTVQQDYEKLMKLQPENIGITFIASVGGLFNFASRTWNLEALLPAVSQFSVPGHYTLQFDSLKIQAKGIQPHTANQDFEDELPEKPADWKNESQLIPAESHTVLSYHVTNNLFNQSEQPWLQTIQGCAHIILFSDVYENHTWHLLPIEEDAKMALEQLCDSVNTDSLLAGYPIVWGNIMQKEALKLLPFHNIDTAMHVAGIIENRLIITKTKESILAYHRELNKQTMKDRDEFLKAVRGTDNNRFSWQIWLKPIPVNNPRDNENLQDRHVSFVESVCFRWINRKDLVRLFADVYFSEQHTDTLPAHWEVSLGGKVTSDPFMMFGKDTVYVDFSTLQIDSDGNNLLFFISDGFNKLAFHRISY